LESGDLASLNVAGPCDKPPFQPMKHDQAASR
jgi:hypothetical protein